MTMEELKMNKIRIKSLIVVVLAFAVGWTGSTISNGQINVGLVTALDSVLGNLLGETTAGATIGIVNPEVAPVNAVRIDISKYSATPTAFSVFYPPDPVMPEMSCKYIMQVNVTPEGIRAIVDHRIVPNFVVETGIINPDIMPAPCYPPDPILPPGGDG
jgi:hypothetical protein